LTVARSLVIGTRNLGKLVEINTILGKLPFEFHSLDEFKDLGTAEETGDSYAQNAIAKAQYYAVATSSWALSDDSGLEVDALSGAPGIYSARYAGAGASDSQRRALLLSELSKTADGERNARFVCVVAVADPQGNLVNVADGICKGTIARISKGNGGFGYDPLFIPDGYSQTFAELLESVKNRISHRARALIATKDFLLSEAVKLDPAFPAS
jgi:XTP/dITP diphosphohydrolase